MSFKFAAEYAYPSGARVITTGFGWGLCCIVFYLLIYLQCFEDRQSFSFFIHNFICLSSTFTKIVLPYYSPLFFSKCLNVMNIYILIKVLYVLSFSDRYIGCKQFVNSFQRTVNYCFCNTNNCNSAAKTLFSPFVMVFSLVVSSFFIVYDSVNSFWESLKRKLMNNFKKKVKL